MVFADKYWVNGEQRIRYWKEGKQDGPSVVLLHGIGAAVEVWQLLVPCLCEHFHVFALDFVGFGKSSKPDWHYAPPILVSLLARFIDDNEIERLSLIGHSMGGGVSLQYTLDHNERVESLVLLASAGLGPVSPWFRQLSSPILLSIAAMVLRSEVIGPAILKWLYGPDLFPDVLCQLSACWHDPLIQRSFSRYMRSVGKGHVIDGLERIVQPTLILWGKKDWVLPFRQGCVAHRLLKNSELHILEGADHGLLGHRPQETNAVICSFLRKTADVRSTARTAL